MNDYDTIIIPYNGDEWAGPNDRCSCGRQAMIVHLTERFGRVGFCGIPGAQPLQGQSDATIDTTDDGQRPPTRRTDDGNTDDGSASPTHPRLTARQQALTAAVRCYYADGSRNIERPDCEAIAVVTYGPIALCPTCDKMRSAVGRTHPPRHLPGAELTALINAARTLAQAETHLAVAVEHARAAGASWSHIADAVGLSRQGAQQRWRHSGDHASTLSTRVDATAEPTEHEVTAMS